MSSDFRPLSSDLRRRVRRVGIAVADAIQRKFSESFGDTESRELSGCGLHGLFVSGAGLGVFLQHEVASGRGVIDVSTGSPCHVLASGDLLLGF